MKRLFSKPQFSYKSIFTSVASCFLLLNSTNIQAQQFVEQGAQYNVTAVVPTQEFGSGVSTFDFDNDGLDDLTMANDYGPIIMYRNTGNGNFTLNNYGVLASAQAKMVLWADYDNDGLADLLVTSYDGRNVLYKNMGDLVFEDHTEEAGLPIVDALNAGASFGDYDRDGFLDLYICVYESNYFSPPVSPSTHNRLYHNNGDGTFTDVTADAGVEDVPHLSLQSVWTDVNNDSWPDLHVINDRLPANFLYINNGDGTFTDMTVQLNLEYPNNCVMSNSISDFDHDGDLDIFMTNNGGSQTPSRLARNEEMEIFNEKANQYNLDLYKFAWGAAWIDGNNDTWDDLIVVLPGTERARYFNSQSGTTFVDDTTAIVVGQDYTCYSPAKGDFNHDGFPDVFIQGRAPNPPMLLINTGGSMNSINITLNGTVSNKGAIGSWIRIYVGGDEIIKYTMCGENYHGQNSQHEHFGMGTNTEIDSISVKYPSGHTDVYRDSLLVNEYYNFTEGETYQVEIESNIGLFSICEGDSLQLNAVAEYSNLIWSTGDTVPSIWVDTAGTYTVSVENEFGITQSQMVDVVLSPNPLVSSITSTPLCNGDSTGTIELINQIEVPFNSVIWSNGDSGSYIDSLVAGTYDYTLVDSNGCAISNSINVLEPSAMQFFSSSTPDVSEANNGTISISIFGGTAPYEIYLDSMLTTDYITDLEAGFYTFQVIDANGCQQELTVEVESVLSISNANKNGLNIYPNPVNNILYIDSDTHVKAIEIIDIRGKLVFSQKQNSNNQYNLQELNHGIYLLKVKLNNDAIETFRLIKQ